MGSRCTPILQLPFLNHRLLSDDSEIVWAKTEDVLLDLCTKYGSDNSDFSNKICVKWLASMFSEIRRV